MLELIAMFKSLTPAQLCNYGIIGKFAGACMTIAKVEEPKIDNNSSVEAIKELSLIKQHQFENNIVYLIIASYIILEIIKAVLSIYNISYSIPDIIYIGTAYIVITIIKRYGYVEALPKLK